MLIEINIYSKSCANKLGGGWEGEKAHRAAKRYHVDSKEIGSTLLLLAPVVIAAKSLHPQMNMSNGEETSVSTELCVV